MDPAKEIAVPVQRDVTYISDEGDTKHTVNDDSAAIPTKDNVVADDEPPPVAPVTSVLPVLPDSSPLRQFSVRHVFNEGSDHRYHLPIAAISPHQPRKTDIEEDVLLWLRLACLDSCLRWERDTGDVDTLR